jgi:hypothetical protein
MENRPDNTAKITLNLTKQNDTQSEYIKNFPRRTIELLIQNMKKIEASRDEGHLQYFQDYVRKYGKTDMEKNLKDSSKNLQTWFMSKEYFEPVKYLPYWCTSNIEMEVTYRLKAKKNPIEALNNILTTGVSFVDCGSAITIAQYLTILDILKEYHGQKAGEEIFAKMFGELSSCPSSKGRMLISQYGILPRDGNSPKQPLSDFSRIGSNPTNSKSKIGKHAHIAIDRTRYLKKHNGGHAGGWNVICIGFNKYGEDLFIGFGLGNQPLTSQEIALKLAALFNEEPSDIEREHLKFLNSVGRGDNIDHMTPDEAMRLVSVSWNHAPTGEFDIIALKNLLTTSYQPEVVCGQNENLERIDKECEPNSAPPSTSSPKL